MSPYQEALKWIEDHPSTGSAGSLAKLILSTWNPECAYSFRECLSNLDYDLTRLAIRLIAHFAANGEDKDLREVGNIVCGRFPRLWEMGKAMTKTRYELRSEWDQEKEARRIAEHADDSRY